MSIEARFRITRGNFRMELELELPSRGVSAIFGPSGCGKTTLLRAIAGLDRHPSGSLTIDDVTWQDAGRFVPPHRRSVGYVFQEASLFAHLSVRRNLEYGSKRAPQSARKVSMAGAVALLGIGSLLERMPDTLSGGERQRVAIARAIAASPRLLLMDEPLSALDRSSKQDILPYLEAVRDELDVPVIYVSHTSEDVARLADHLVMVEAGHVTAAGPIRDMLTRLDLPLAHGSDAEVVVDAVVAGHDADYQLTVLDCDGAHFRVAGTAPSVGARVRLRLAARDVSIVLERPSATSILNVFPASVEAVAPESGGQVTVRLRMGNTPILSRITRKSADALGLEAGKQVYAQIKSVALVN